MRKAILLPVILVGAAIAGCDRGAPAPKAVSEIVLYSSIDEPYLTPLLKQFEQQNRIHVRVVTDTEATKSAGLAEKIEAEKNHPQADVYWGNEIFHTISLAERGIFAPYRPASAEDVPTKWRGKDDLFTGVGLRARMLVVSTRPEFKEAAGAIHNLADLLNPALKGKIGISHPGFGTGSGHIAALYVAWGEPKFLEFMKQLRSQEVRLLGGNSVVVDQVAAGNLIAGLSDNDDINNAKTDGQKIDGVLPDQGDGAPGTLLIPTTIALVKNGPHPDDAKKLIDFLCQRSIEHELIAGRFLAYSVRDAGKAKSMDVDYVECSHQMRRAIETALNILQDREKN